ncbi:MAG: hypothetical protein WCY09_01500 [Candidatus Omnitrophota bacterium]
MKISLNNLFKVSFFLLAALFCSTILSKLTLGENNDLPKEKNETGSTIQQALMNYEKQKQNNQEELAAKLNFRLGQVTEEWITLAEKDKESKLNTFIEQNWDKQARTYMITPVRYEYSLKGYSYNVIDINVVKTDSITSPYKGVVTVKEELYAEKYHHPNISDTNLYFYTVTNMYTLNFEYRNETFVLVNSENKMLSIVNEIPGNIRKQWL